MFTVMGRSRGAVHAHEKATAVLLKKQRGIYKIESRNASNVQQITLYVMESIYCDF
jgi:hypothetical protein